GGSAASATSGRAARSARSARPESGVPTDIACAPRPHVTGGRSRARGPTSHVCRPGKKARRAFTVAAPSSDHVTPPPTPFPEAPPARARAEGPPSTPRAPLAQPGGLMTITRADVILAVGTYELDARRGAPGHLANLKDGNYTLHHILPYRYPLFAGYLAQCYK